MASRREVLIGGGGLAFGGLASPAGAAALDSRFSATEQRLSGFVADGRLPFAAIQVALKGKTVFQGFYSGRSRIGPGSLYRVFSMTKPVTAAAVAALCEDGKLTLEAPVASVIPEFAGLSVSSVDGSVAPARPMTVAHLLTHASGLGSSWSGKTSPAHYKRIGLEAGTWMYDPKVGGLAGFAGKIASAPLEFQPGEGWLYGFSHDIAGLVVERVSGQSFGSYVKQRLLEPLGMTATGFSVPAGQAERLSDLYLSRGNLMVRIERGVHSKALQAPLAESGSAGLVSSLEDYSRFAALLANGGAVGGRTVLKPETVRLITRPYGSQEKVAEGVEKIAGVGLGGSGRGLGQGLGGIVTLDATAGPGSAGEYGWGGAASTTFWSTPGLGLSVVVMTQVMPSGTVPLRDELRPLIYAAIA